MKKSKTINNKNKKVKKKASYDEYKSRIPINSIKTPATDASSYMLRSGHMCPCPTDGRWTMSELTRKLEFQLEIAKKLLDAVGYTEDGEIYFSNFINDSEEQIDPFYWHEEVQLLMKGKHVDNIKRFN